MKKYVNHSLPITHQQPLFSSHVVSSSTTSQATSSLPSSTTSTTTNSEGMTKSEFKKLDTENLLQYLSSNGVDVSKIEAIFRDEEIDGQSLLGFTFDNLKSMGVKGGTAGKIIKNVNDLK